MRDQALLSALGLRLRELRSSRGRTLTELAESAGLSRRFVTEVEAGRANPSVAKLAALARSLNVGLAELCDLPLGDSGAEIQTERIALVGLRGAGKSSVGRLLAERLAAAFVELDERVEVLAGMSLAEIFDLRGERTYRRLEREALELCLAESGRLVIATGGSIVHALETFARLRGACRTVWLRARPEDHLERVLAQGDRRPVEGRPRAMEELRAILAGRGAAYGSCELTVDTSGREVEQVVAQIEAWAG
jgi:XRE family aerobic/anaerobic benzoate catabolism transcriptional regulator